MKLFLLLLPIIFITSFSVAMEQQQEANIATCVCVMCSCAKTDEEQFNKMITILEQSKGHMYNLENGTTKVTSDSILRTELNSMLDCEELSEIDQCLLINQTYEQINQIRIINTVLYQLYRDYMEANRAKAITMYNRGHHEMAKKWLYQAMNNAEYALICLSEIQQDEEVLQKADITNTMIETSFFLNEIYDHSTPVHSSR